MCDHSSSPELCFVQRYDILTRNDVLVERIDKTLRCFRLRWYKAQPKRSGLEQE